jgi:hypothetical protein
MSLNLTSWGGERTAPAALRDALRHMHEWYALLSDRQRAAWGGLKVTFADEGFDVTVETIYRPYKPVWSDETPPGGLVCNICGQPVESEPCAEHAPQEGH